MSDHAIQTRDAALFSRIRQGDEYALKELARLYGLSLCTVAASVLGSNDGAEDVLQDILLSLWDTRESLSVPNNIAGYLHRAARNRAIDLMRHEHAQRRRAERVHSREPDIERASWNDAERQLAERDVESRLQGALLELPPSLRQVFMLSWAGMTYEEIANILGITRESVRKQMYRATQRLMHLFEP